jgi:hypothetical protein
MIIFIEDLDGTEQQFINLVNVYKSYANLKIDGVDLSVGQVFRRHICHKVFDFIFLGLDLDIIW